MSMGMDVYTVLVILGVLLAITIASIKLLYWWAERPREGVIHNLRYTQGWRDSEITLFEVHTSKVIWYVGVHGRKTELQNGMRIKCWPLALSSIMRESKDTLEPNADGTVSGLPNFYSHQAIKKYKVL